MVLLCCGAATRMASIPGSPYFHRRHASRPPEIRAARRYAALLLTGARSMLDVAFLVIGALFLGVCALYALACDHL
jgi:hypothetical protein